MTKAGADSLSGVRQARAESIDDAPSSANLLRSPLTCMWSAPATRHNVDQAR